MGESLRDQLSAAFTEEEQKQETPVEKPQEVVQETAPETPAEPTEQKPGRTAGRARDEQGRLLPGPAKKDEAAAEKAPAATPSQAPAPQAAAKPHPNRPSSWKKDYWEDWGKLDPRVADYILQRESEAAKGVSTYKAEYDRLKAFDEVVAPNRQLFQQHGIDPVQQFSKYVEIHKGLALGDPQQKLGMLLRIAQDYQIPLHGLFVQGQDGRQYINPNLQPAQVPQPAQQQSDPRNVVREILLEERANQEIAAMQADTNKYPHFETVRQTMLGLLQGGIAQDLPQAYEAAIRLPQHSEIWDELQQQKRDQEEQQKRAQEARRVAAAKANQVSTKTATPSGAPAGGKKGLRSSYEEAFSDTEGRV